MNTKRKIIISAVSLIALATAGIIFTIALPSSNIGILFNKPVKFDSSFIDKKPIALSIAKNAPLTTEVYSQLGYEYTRNGQFTDAVFAYQRAKDMEPDNADIFYNLGVSYFKIGESKNAVQMFEKAVSLNRNDPAAYYNLGASYGQIGLWKKAIKSYKKAIKLSPNYMNAYYNLGIAYGMIDNWKSSAHALNQILKVNPNDMDAHYNLALIGLIINDKRLCAKHSKILKEFAPDMASRVDEIRKG